MNEGLFVVGFIVSGNPYQEILVGKATNIRDAEGLAFEDAQQRGWAGVEFVKGVGSTHYCHPVVKDGDKLKRASYDYIPYVIHVEARIPGTSYLPIYPDIRT
jgi:hypothetical protein